MVDEVKVQTREQRITDQIVLVKKVAALYETGLSPLEIMVQLKISHAKTVKCIKEAYTLWRTQAVEAIEARKLREAMKLDLVEQEAWDSWQLSKGLHKQVTEIIELEPMMQKGSKTPPVAYFEGKPMSTFHPTRAVRTELITGELGCLRIIMECIAARRKLFGLDAPQRTSLENPDGTNLLSKLEVVFMPKVVEELDLSVDNTSNS